MRTIQSTPENLYFGKSKIYLDELEKIYAVMARASSEIHLRVGNTVFDDLAEASEHLRDAQVRRIHMSIRKRSEYDVSLDIGANSSTIFLGPELISVGIACEIAQVINSAKLGPNILWNGWARFIGFVGVMITYYLMSINELSRNWSFLDLAILVWVFAGQLKVFAHTGTLSFKRREDFAVVWKPNVQDLVKMAIGGAISLGIAWLSKRVI